MSIFKLQHGMAGHKMVLRRSNMRKRMSALGQKQTSRLVRAMSALPPKADIEPRSRDVRFVPKAEQQIPGLAMIRLASRQAKGRTVATAGASASLPVLSRASCCAPPPRPR